ncbi:MAG: DegV family protein [Christensenellales bacterium]
MAANYVFMTDSDSDLPWQYAREKGIPVVKMPYSLDGLEYFDDNGEAGTEKAFFDKMRQGATPVTSLLPTAAYLEYFEPILAESDLLFLAFSSKMSATFLNILEAQKELLEKYPQRQFVVVDTLSISAPQTLLIKGAHALYEQGASIQEVEAWVIENRTRAQVWVTVDDLVYLRRGGRISSTSAIFGSMLNIKPLLTMTREGKLEAFAKVQGSRKAMKAMVDKTAELIERPEEQEIIILQGDVPEEAEQLKQMLLQRVPQIKSVFIQIIGPVIGSHAGPGTLAVSFMGKERPV